MTKPLIYIAGPYTNPDPVLNTRNAVHVGLRIYERTGAGVIIPHLSLLAHAMHPHNIDYWYKFDLALLAPCTALYRIEGQSTGADNEVAFAHEHDIPVYTKLPALYKTLGCG